MATVPQPEVPAPPRPGQGAPRVAAPRETLSHLLAPSHARPLAADPAEASPFAPGAPPAAAPGEHPHRRSVSGIHVPGASALYALLAALLLLGGVAALVTPERLTDW